MPIYVQNRELVTPGTLLAENEKFKLESPTVFKYSNKIYASTIGLVDISNGRINVIPLEGKYIPKVGDLVIGLIEDYGITYWIVDIKSPYKAILNVAEALNRPFNPLKENVKNIYDIGDYVLARVIAFDRTKDPILTAKQKGLGKITKGRIVEIIPSRVPRVIGRKASMITMLKNETKCQITVGLNGRIWIIGPSPELEEIAILAIKKIEYEAHTSGLTDRIRNFIRKEIEKRGLKVNEIRRKT
ncbi:MAG TPA: RNA-binding protein [Desulfurococcales archaeon]|nr:RNA-binding protein [Desulfurococcales archaeon]